ncbi:hypothetical protein [Streptomyces sp. XD-27]|uniref:hypothetical protein n=1 Tax=Streptomyces sp. XD-27 TaxID=3062779 RepID=UPI0026F44EDB|nr:hypothetical protein [Streptomyces sp. XD-27]WKX69393.1 hypothetical protein Q3Y56_05210 [Streptomyces sp. XD-27]
MNHDADAALDALLAAAEAGVLRAIEESLDAECGWGLVYWHAAPSREVPLPRQPDPYAAYQEVEVPGTLPVPPSEAAGAGGAGGARTQTLVDVVADAHRATDLLDDFMATASGETYLLHGQLDARIACLHHRLSENNLNGSLATTLTLAVRASARRIRNRLVHGLDSSLSPADTTRALGLCVSIVTAMDSTREVLQELFADHDAVAVAT